MAEDRPVAQNEEKNEFVGQGKARYREMVWNLGYIISGRRSTGASLSVGNV